MKRLLWLLLAAVFILAGCGEQEVGPVVGEEISVYAHWLAEDFGEDFKPDKNGRYSAERQMIIYDAYCLGVDDWLLFAVTITGEGCQQRLFRLTNGGDLAGNSELQSLCRWPENDYFPVEEWGFQSFYLAETGVCALYNHYRQQFCFYDLATGEARQVALPESLALAENERAVCLTENLFLLGRQANARLRLSIYDMAADEERPLLELNGESVRACVQPAPESQPGRWLLLTNAGELCDLQLAADGAQVQGVYSCPQEWPAADNWQNYNAMQLVPNIDLECILLSVCCEDAMVYQVVGLAEGLELGRYTVPQFVKIEDMQICNEQELLGVQGSQMYFPYYAYNSKGRDMWLLAYDYLADEELEIYNNLNQPTPRQEYFYKGVCSPDGSQLLLVGRNDLRKLPLAECLEQAEHLTCRQEEGLFRLDLPSGLLWLNGQKLGRCDLPELDGANDERFSGLRVERTPAGNYLLVLDGQGSGTLSYGLRSFCWLSVESGRSWAALCKSFSSEEMPQSVCYTDGRAWLSGSDELLCIDEATGKRTAYPVGRSWWTDGCLVLTGGASGFNLRGLGEERGCDLTDLLLTDEVKAQAEALLRDNDPRAYPAADSFGFFWECLGRTELFGTSDPVPYLVFVGEQAGRLDFELRCHYYNKLENCTDTACFPLGLELAEIVEMFE